MKCSEIREALSAMADGEEPGIDAALVRAHLSGCQECAAFQRATAALGVMTVREQAATGSGPDLAARVVAGIAARRRRRRLGLVVGLRWAIAVAGVVELLTALALTWSAESSAGGQAHESHESVSMTAALCVGLIYVALRPRLAGSYLPVLGVSALLLVLTSVVDVSQREVTLHHELPHTSLVVGVLLVVVLAITQGGAGTRGSLLRRSRAARGTHVPVRLRAVSRVVVPVRSVLSRFAVRPASPRLASLARPLARRWGRLAAALGMTSVLVLIGGPASAHAVLEQSTPGQGAVVKVAPSDVVLTYDENVSLLPDSVRVFAPDGSRVDDGVVGHAGGDGATATVGLRATERGTYLVSWRVISADSHPVSGAFTFSVGRVSAAPTATGLHNDPAVAGLLGIGRWIGYAGSALLLGGLAFGLLCLGGRESAPRGLLLGGAAALAASALIGLLAKGALDAGLGLAAVGRPSLVREVLGTTFGRATLARLVLAVLGAGWVWLGLGRVRAAAARTVVAAALAIGVAVSFAAAGHAVAGEHRFVTMLSDSAHVLAASTWLGGLVLVLVVLRRRPADAVVVTARFSRVALTSVAVLVATGVYQAWRQVGAWGALTATTYGKELVVKLVVVAAAIVLAAASRWWLWRMVRPGLVVHAATTITAEDAADTAAPIGQLRRTVAAEVVLGMLVLGLTSALVATEPAVTAYHPVVSANLTIEHDLVQVSAVPAGDRTMDLHLYVFGPDQQPSDPKQITATVSLPAQDIGPLPVVLQPAGPGHRTGTVAVPVAGAWQLAVTVRTTAIDESTQYVALPIR